MNLLSAAYGRATTLRRAWYGRAPHRSRRLGQPVISVGNLVVGGSGKTPLVATLAKLLLAASERPAILSRGYGRRDAADGIVVVSDGERVLATPSQSGDEPYMLASTLPGVPVLSSQDRYLSGCLAERHFGCTVHILDDGFQHVQLARDIDLLLMSKEDLDERLLPCGRLREPLSAGRFADALLVAGSDDEVQAVAARVGAQTAFRVATRYLEARVLSLSHALSHVGPTGARAIAVAGIARPERFFGALRSLGWDVVREMTFRDHHWFTSRDIAAIESAAAAAGADIITTEKDAVRVVHHVGAHHAGRALSGPPWGVLPIEASVEPADRFASWLSDRLSAARRRMEAA